MDGWDCVQLQVFDLSQKHYNKDEVHSGLTLSLPILSSPWCSRWKTAGTSSPSWSRESSDADKICPCYWCLLRVPVILRRVWTAAAVGGAAMSLWVLLLISRRREVFGGSSRRWRAPCSHVGSEVSVIVVVRQRFPASAEACPCPCLVESDGSNRAERTEMTQSPKLVRHPNDLDTTPIRCMGSADYVAFIAPYLTQATHWQKWTSYPKEWAGLVLQCNFIHF
jgi:hypothetical protein